MEDKSRPVGPSTLVKDWTFGPRQVLDFGAEKYTLKCYELYEAKIESFQA